MFFSRRGTEPQLVRITRTSLSFLLLCSTASVLAQPVILQSIVHNQVGSTASIVNGVAVDLWGDDMLMTGWRTDVLDFGGVPHEAGTGAIFLTRVDLNGNVVWSKVSGSADILGNNKGLSVAVDDYNSSVYNVGQLFAAEEANFDGTVLPAGALGYVAKYSASGTLLWVKDFPAGVYSIAVDYAGNPFVNLGDNTIAKLDPANGNTVASAPASGDLQNVVYHNIVVGEGNNVVAQWGNSITKYDNALNEIWSTPISKPFGAETYRITIDTYDYVWATFYAMSGTVSLGGTDYTSFPAGYVYQLDAATGDVLTCLSPGAFKLKELFEKEPGGNGFIVSGDFAFNSPYVVKYDNQFEQVWAVPTFTTVDMALIYDDAVVLGGSHSEDITADGTIYARPNASGQDNAIAGYLSGPSLGMADRGRAKMFRVWPNPADDKVSIFVYNREVVHVSDAAGNRIWTGQISGNGTLNVGGWPAGIYTVRNSTGGTARLMVAH